MTKWFYKGRQIKTLEDIPVTKPFIVYRIKFPEYPNFKDSKFYWGSKQVFSVKRCKLSQKRSKLLYSGRGSYPKYETKRTESDWKNYRSSSKVVNQMIDDDHPAEFEILEFYETKREMLLQEALLIIKGFLENDPNLLNAWVSIRANKTKQ